MSRTNKLFVAAVLVATGFGVAKLLGDPEAKKQALEMAGRVLPSPLARASSGATTPASSGVRLVPDFEAAAPQPTIAAPRDSFAKASTPAGGRGKGDLTPLEPFAVDRRDPPPPSLLPLQKDDAPKLEAAPALAANDTNLTSPLRAIAAPPMAAAAPRAKLRNEAPRPLDFDAQTAATLAAAQPVASEPVNHFPLAAGPANRSSRDSWLSGNSASADFGQGGPAPAIRASYEQATEPISGITPIGPPPWPAPAEASSPRTHIVVDGDSLPRLAGLYLDDPRRGVEIFQANRGVLTDPELLPIGAELQIPLEARTPGAGDRGPQSLAPRNVAIHAASSSSLVPVRPVPAAADVAPRAQLARPLPVQ